MVSLRLCAFALEKGRTFSKEQLFKRKDAEEQRVALGLKLIVILKRTQWLDGRMG